MANEIFDANIKRGFKEEIKPDYEFPIITIDEIRNMVANSREGKKGRR